MFDFVLVFNIRLAFLLREMEEAYIHRFEDDRAFIVWKRAQEAFSEFIDSPDSQPKELTKRSLGSAKWFDPIKFEPIERFGSVCWMVGVEL
jgi:hypothetical protein